MNKLAFLPFGIALAFGAAAPASAQYAVIVPPANAAVAVTAGWWYNPAEGGSGYGISRNSNGDIFFGAYGYSDSGSGAADWMFATLSEISTNVYVGALNHCTRGQMLSSNTFAPSTCVASGQNAQLTFTGANAATLQYTGGRVTQIQPFTSF